LHDGVRSDPGRLASGLAELEPILEISFAFIHLQVKPHLCRWDQILAGFKARLPEKNLSRPTEMLFFENNFGRTPKLERILISVVQHVGHAEQKKSCASMDL
jgi:hypothetical protein